MHVRGGQFYRWAVRGWVCFDDETRRHEARRLLDLRYRLSAMVADEYAAAGFAAVSQDNIYGPDVERWLRRTGHRPRYLVVLRPSVAVLEARHEARRRATGKIAYRPGYTPAQNDTDLAGTRGDLGLWLDTSDHTPDDTVAEILAWQDQAVVL